MARGEKHPRRGPIAGALLTPIAAWSLFAFGGAYLWTTLPLIAGAIVLAAVVRPRLAADGARALDLWLTIALFAAALQLVPLSPSLRLRFSPALATVDRALRFDAPAEDRAGPPAPLSVDATEGAEALALAIAVVFLFWSARAIFERGSIRRTVLQIAILGAIASAIALAQHLTAPRLLYWTWQPVNRNASPYSPFVNRNDLAGWLVMAAPLAAGYMLARLETQRREGHLGLESALDRTGVWLSASLCVMMGALVATVSRSGLTAIVAAAVTLVWASRGRLGRRGRRWLTTGLGLAMLAGAAYANVDALMTRVGETMTIGVGGRREIWRVTMTIVHDFWLTGVGVGAFERAMSLYQPPHVFAFNHAHDEYLQVLSEGGLLVAVPILIVVVAGAWGIVRALRRDRSPAYWLRAGAASAIVGIAVQSIWETSLRMPAVSVLFALCAAIALHRRT